MGVEGIRLSTLLADDLANTELKELNELDADIFELEVAKLALLFDPTALDVVTLVTELLELLELLELRTVSLVWLAELVGLDTDLLELPA